MQILRCKKSRIIIAKDDFYPELADQLKFNKPEWRQLKAPTVEVQKQRVILGKKQQDE
jgi:hypothetical protein